MNVENKLVKKNGRSYWLMGDGSIVPNIFGGSGDDNSDKNTLLEEADKKVKVARDEAIKYRLKLKEAKKEFEGVDISEYKELKAEKKARINKKAVDKGEFESLMAKNEAAHKETVEKANAESKEWKNKYDSMLINNELKDLASANSAVDNSSVLTILKSKYDISVEDGKVVMYGHDGVAVSTSDAMSTLMKDSPFLVKSGNIGAGGADGVGSKGEQLTSLQLISRGLKSL